MDSAPALSHPRAALRQALIRPWTLALLAALALGFTGCGATQTPAPLTAEAQTPPTPPLMTLDRLIGWLSSSKHQYDLQEKTRPVEGFAAFFQAGLPQVLVPMDRRLMLARLQKALKPSRRGVTDQQQALEDAVLVDRRGGIAWQAYLKRLAREGRAIVPAPLWPPGTVELTEDGARILYPRGQTAWAFYLACKAAARTEPEFRAWLGAPDDADYRWTVAEEQGCLNIFAEAVARAASEGATPRGLAAHVLAARSAGVLEGYAVVEVLGPLAPGRLALLSPGARRAGRAYLRWAARPIEGLPPPTEVADNSLPSARPLTGVEGRSLKAAVAALDAGAVRQALQVLEALATRHRRHPGLWRALAAARLRNNAPEAAAEAALRARDADPADPRAWALLARARLAAGDPHGAETAAHHVRWRWWLGRDPEVMRAPVLFWGSAGGGAVLERLDRPLSSGDRFWWVRPHGPDGPRRQVLSASSPAEALHKAGVTAEAHPQER